jgi:hypothetical protein
MRKSLIAGALAASMAAPILVTATPASAATWQTCNNTVKRNISLPGFADISVSVKLCVQRLSSTRVRVYPTVSWGSYLTKSRKRFNSFSIYVEVRRYGVTKAHANYTKLAKEMNAHGKGSDNLLFTDATGNAAKVRGLWNAYAQLKYDVANDGKPSTTWTLIPTNAVS